MKKEMGQGPEMNKYIESLYKARANNIAIIGVGNMGGVLAQALVGSKLKDPMSLMLTKRTLSDLERFKATGYQVIEDNATAVLCADTILLSVKPHQVKEALEEIKPLVSSEKIIISVAAGITISTIDSIFSNLKVKERPTAIRAMPNLSTKYGLGVTGWFSERKLNESKEKLVNDIFESMGIVVKTKTEDGIDRITAAASSMIGFLFFISEVSGRITNDILSGEISEKNAKEITSFVWKGAQFMMENDGRSAAELRQAVTSPNGTTFAGLEYFKKQGLADIFEQGVYKAYLRSLEMGKENEE